MPSPIPSRWRRAAHVAAAAVALTGCAGNTVPAEYRSDLRKAAKECRAVTARLLAAQIEQESGWDPEAVSRRGAQGIAQFMPQTWGAWGFDANGDGTADPFDPVDAIRSQGRLMCHLVGLARESGLEGDPVDLALAAYNAGWSPVLEYGGIPPYPETQSYVPSIRERAESIRVSPPR